MLTARSRSVTGTLRQEVLIDGKHTLVTDEPLSLGGDDTGPAPHELFPAALASCISTSIVMYARTKSWDVGEVEVEVAYDNKATPRAFDIKVHLDPKLSPEQVERLEKVAETCPVRRAIESGIVFDESVDQGD